LLLLLLLLLWLLVLFGFISMIMIVAMMISMVTITMIATFATRRRRRRRRLFGTAATWRRRRKIEGHQDSRFFVAVVGAVTIGVAVASIAFYVFRLVVFSFLSIESVIASIVVAVLVLILVVILIVIVWIIIPTIDFAGTFRQTDPNPRGNQFHFLIRQQTKISLSCGIHRHCILRFIIVSTILIILITTTTTLLVLVLVLLLLFLSLLIGILHLQIQNPQGGNIMTQCHLVIPQSPLDVSQHFVYRG